MTHRWFNDPFMRRWFNGTIFPLPKAQPGLDRWHHPFVIMGVN